MFISNNLPSFHLRWKKNLVKYWKVSKDAETDCLQNFLFLFMFLLTAKFVKNSHIQSRTFFIFLKNVLKQIWNYFNTKFKPQWKDRKSSYKHRQILEPFCHLIALVLASSRVKSLRVTKNVKRPEFEGVWGELESK